MQPLFGPNLAPVLPVTATPALRLADGARPDTGEPAAARVRAETAERVDPPRAAAGPADPRLDGRRGTAPPPEPPPDPRLPAGPPPAFGQSPLERQRQELREPAALVPEIADPRADGPPGAQAAPRDGRQPDPASDRAAAALDCVFGAESAPTDGAPSPAPGLPGTTPEAPAPDFASGRRALSPETRPSIDVLR
jgi:hypothetical protein